MLTTNETRVGDRVRVHVWNIPLLVAYTEVPSSSSGLRIFVRKTGTPSNKVCTVVCVSFPVVCKNQIW